MAKLTLDVPKGKLLWYTAGRDQQNNIKGQAPGTGSTLEIPTGITLTEV